MLEMLLSPMRAEITKWLGALFKRLRLNESQFENESHKGITASENIFGNEYSLIVEVEKELLNKDLIIFKVAEKYSHFNHLVILDSNQELYVLIGVNAINTFTTLMIRKGFSWSIDPLRNEVSFIRNKK